MLEVLLIRPGATTFDEEGRIKGALDIPLSVRGQQQADDLAQALSTYKLECLYVGPCESAAQSAKAIRTKNACKQRVLECLRNLDHGLWQGKLVSDVKRCQPKVYRQFQEHPSDVCPPGGETVQEALQRVVGVIDKLKKRHRGGRIGMLVPQPMAAVVRYGLVGGSLGDLWEAELDFGNFEVLQVDPEVSRQPQTAFV